MSAPAVLGNPRTGTAWRLALAALLLYAVSGGGRIAGSDEVTMFEVSRALLHGHVAVPEGATLQGADGRFYSKNAAGQAVLALPLTALAEGVTAVAPFTPEKRILVERALVSLFNAGVCALLLAVFYGTARALGVGATAALGAALMLGFTTPLWVYAKSFMAEPLEALGLLLALGGAARAVAGEKNAPRLAALGVLIAVSSKLSVLPLALACLLPFLALKPATWRWPALGLALAMLGHGVYDLARFGNLFETGYGAQATPAAYSTPLRVGVYGLLLSSGKGVMWFAPALWLVPFGVAAMRRGVGPGPGPAGEVARLRARRLAASAIGMAWAAALVLYGRFQHWAGDGSFGPRYLVPLLPLGFVPVAFACDRMRDARRTAALGLAAAGLLVTLGGVAIYYGAQMREVGDYPYRLALDDPHFMEASHFNPRYTPVVGHWRMLVRNLGEHLRGEWPRLGGAGAPDARLGVSAEDQHRLLHALDFWWAYALYEGVPAIPLLLAALGIKLAALWVLWLAARAAGREARAP